ncbi:MAG: M48 family metalloprotease [Deltaproteobacteria bacterium]|nr:M48 family metalloprotease [Deltaproteobacteria bacterium]
MRRLKSYGVMLGACVSLLACAVNLTPEGLMKTFTAIQDANKDLTPENEYYVGRSVATNLLARHDYRYRDTEAIARGDLIGITEYVGTVGALLAASATETERKGDRPSPIAGWHFTVVEHDSINAFAAPGGYVFVTTAAVKAAKSEDELAAILAHEVAHVVRGHALGSIKKSRWAGVAKEAVNNSVTLDEAALGELTQVFDGAMNDMMDAIFVKGYSRDTEFEADSVGAAIMAHAGYDTRAFASYLETLRAKQGNTKGGMFATHPSAADRIKLLGKTDAARADGHALAARSARFATARASLN